MFEVEALLGSALGAGLVSDGVGATAEPGSTPAPTEPAPVAVGGFTVVDPFAEAAPSADPNNASTSNKGYNAAPSKKKKKTGSAAPTAASPSPPATLPSPLTTLPQASPNAAGAATNPPQ